eukprot:scaffold2482_cov166-Amphora_coffeaeformis.AAC.8
MVRWCVGQRVELHGSIFTVAAKVREPGRTQLTTLAPDKTFCFFFYLFHPIPRPAAFHTLLHPHNRSTQAPPT